MSEAYPQMSDRGFLRTQSTSASRRRDESYAETLRCSWRGQLPSRELNAVAGSNHAYLPKLGVEKEGQQRSRQLRRLIMHRLRLPSTLPEQQAQGGNSTLGCADRGRRGFLSGRLVANQGKSHPGRQGTLRLSTPAYLLEK